MISTVRQVSAAALARVVPKPSLADRYDFVPAGAYDRAELMQFALDHFLATEPHCQALGITRDNGYGFIEGIIEKCLKHDYSLRIVDRETDKLIGIRVMSVIKRGVPYDNGNTTNENEQMMTAILDKLKADFWRLRPEANKVLLREVTCVHRDHQRQGIAQFLVHLGLDFNHLRASGIDGIMSEASSIANQKLLEKNGYRELSSSDRSQYIRSDGSAVVFPDGTRSLKLFYLNLN